MVVTVDANGRETDSYVSMMTGLHRKDVKRLRRDISNAPKRLALAPMAAVMSRWANLKPFGDGRGHPRPLARYREGGAANFEDLVRACKVDIPAATVLAEMDRQELIAVGPEGMLTLLNTTFVPRTDDAALAALEATLSDHLRVAVENAVAHKDEPRQFDRVVRYSHLSPASVASLEAAARDRATNYLEELNALALELQKQDDASGQAHRGRFVSGIYVAPVSVSEDPEE